MRRSLLLPLLVLATALAGACGGGSSGGSSSATTVPQGAVAVVGDREVPVSDLNHLIQVRLNALKQQNAKLPKAGTDAYQTQVVQPLVGFLVFQAQVHNIAKQLGISVTSDDVTKSLDSQIQQFYKGDKKKYESELKRAGTTNDDVRRQIEENLLEQKIQQKLVSEVNVTDADISSYYDKNKSQYSTPDTRVVRYILMPSKKLAERARAQLANGASWKQAAKGSIDTSAKQPSGTFEAQKGGLEKNFQDAAFTLPTGTLSALVQVSKSYADSAIAGKCKPDCFFIIQPVKDVKKGGQKSLDEVKDQIRQQLQQTQQQTHVQSRIKALLAQQKKLTRYAQAYRPPPTPSTAPAAPPTS